MEMVTETRQLEIFDLLNVNLDAFSGPLELLLDLIRRKKMDIQTVALAEICQPYLVQLEMMEAVNMEIAVEFLDIASTLMLIKSKALLPEADLAEEDGIDTEAQLRLRLVEYQKNKELADVLNRRSLLGREHFARPEMIDEEGEAESETYEELTVYGLIQAYRQLMCKRDYRKPHQVVHETVSIEEQILTFLRIFSSGADHAFFDLCPHRPSRAEIIISLLALLELSRRFLLNLYQIREFGPIHCRPVPDIAAHIGLYKAQLPNAS
jgi:segregation and condensation protein A